MELLSNNQKRKLKIKTQFDTIHFLKKKLNSKKHFSINGRKFHTCKHKEISNLYFEVFGSDGFNDYQNYLKSKEELGEGYIYVVGNKEHKVCKIGFSRNVFKRISGIQTGCPFLLEIFCIINGDIATEKKLHKKYASIKLSGEWFKYEGKLKESISKVESVITEFSLINRRVDKRLAREDRARR